MGYRGRLFRIGSDYQVGEAVDGYDAVGSGEQAVLGALCASKGKDLFERVLLALQAAERVNAWVGCPFTVICRETRTLQSTVTLVDEVVHYSGVAYDANDQDEGETHPGMLSSPAA